MSNPAGDQLISQVSSYVDASEAENAADDAQIASLQTQLAGLNAQIAELQSDDAADAAEIAASQLQAVALQEQIAVLQSNDASDAAQIASLISQVATLQAQNDALVAQNAAEESSQLDLGDLTITVTTSGENATEAKFDLPDGSSVVRQFPASGPLTIKLGVGLGLHHHRVVGGGGGGAPEWLPDGAAAYADPVLEHYYADGAERMLSDLFSGVNARDASGITVDGVVDNYPVATALLRDAMPDSGWSMVIEWEQVGMEVDRRLLVIHDALEEHGAEIVIQTDSELWLSSWFGGYDNSTSPITAALHKIGFTYNGSDFTLSSIDGATETVSSPGSDPIVVAVARFGTNIGNTNPLMGTFKKITIYEPMNQTQLNSITAP